MPIEIPKEQLEAILPTITRLRDSIERLSADLPFDADSALAFDPAPEDPR